MPLLTTLGASSAKAFKVSPAIWYNNGTLAEGVVFNLQGDSVYHNYNDGVDLGVYTGPIYLDDLWNRVLFGSLASINYPEPDLALVNGRYDLGVGLKWYYHGELADGYIQNLATYDLFVDFFTPVSTLTGWHSFDQGTDDGAISGEHNVDGQGILRYVDGGLASGQLKITPDNLWHNFSGGVDQGLINDFNPATGDGSQLQQLEVVWTATQKFLVFQGVPFTGNFYDNSYFSLWRQVLEQDRTCFPSAFSFVDGVCTGALTGDHTVVNAEFQNVSYLFRDGENMQLQLVIRSVNGSLRTYYILDQYNTITDSGVYEGFLVTEANMQLLCNTAEPREKAYLVLGGQLAQTGCRTLDNDVYCIGADGLIEGWDHYNSFSNPEPDCANCVPYYF